MTRDFMIERYKFNVGLYNFVFLHKGELIMKCTVKAFGISRDIVGGRELEMELPDGSTVSDLKKELFQKYPTFIDLKSLYVALNNEYANEQAVLKAGDEIALIPPVSGG
jgi:molybdopterin converting factor subunit 1